MQTIYYTTPNFIRHEDNLVNLTEYRRKLALAQGQPDQAEEEQPVRTRTVRRRAASSILSTLDFAASIAVILTAVSFAVEIL